jgi:hypothetical protein
MRDYPTLHLDIRDVKEHERLSNITLDIRDVKEQHFY